MKRKPGEVECPKCHRTFKPEGLQEHYNTKHGKADRKRIAQHREKEAGSLSTLLSKRT